MHNWNFKMLFYFGTPLVSKRDEQSLINFITPYALNMLLGGGRRKGSGRGRRGKSRGRGRRKREMKRLPVVFDKSLWHKNCNGYQDHRSGKALKKISIITQNTQIQK